jgi:hypothetical protein
MMRAGFSANRNDPMQPRLTFTEAEKKIALADSFGRMEVLFTCMMQVSGPGERLRLFLGHYDMCDAPWGWRSLLLSQLRSDLEKVPLVDVLVGEARRMFDALPEEVQIYRGCEEGRVRGLSWSTDPAVARGFAFGKRCRNSAPTLAEAVIPKGHILGAFASRTEAEIVPDPRRLRRLKVQRLSADEESAA